MSCRFFGRCLVFLLVASSICAAVVAQPVARPLANLNLAPSELLEDSVVLIANPPVGGRVFALMEDPVKGHGLYATDGTNGSLTLLIPGWVSYLDGSGSGAYFSVSELDEENRMMTALWFSDGTRSGTSAFARVHELGPFSYLESGKALSYVDVEEGGARRILRSVGGATPEVVATGVGYPSTSVTLSDGTWMIVTTLSLDEERIVVVRGATASTFDPGIQDVTLIAALGERALLFGEQSGQDFLWSTNGTGSGTRKLTPVESFSYYKADNQRFFMPTTDNGKGKMLVSDGTASGTRKIDFGLGGDYYAIKSGVVVDGRLYLNAPTAGLGYELVKIDATSVSMVKDICFGVCSSDSQSFTVADNGIFFTANDGVHGAELWFSDGSNAGTKLVADLDAYNSTGSDSYSSISDLTPALDGVFFLLDDEVGFSDSTAQGTRMLDIFYTYDLSVAQLDDRAVLATSGWTLHTSAGTASTTSAFASALSSNVDEGSYPGPFVAGPSSLVFEASADDYSSENLYSVDATGSLSELNLPGVDSFSGLDNYGWAGDTLIYATYDGLFAHRENQAGLLLSSDALGSAEWLSVGNRLYVFSGYTMLVTDGTAAGTRAVWQAGPGAGSRSNPLRLVGETVYFETYEDGESAIYRTDGTTATTSRVLDTTDTYPASWDVGSDGTIFLLTSDALFSYRSGSLTTLFELADDQAFEYQVRAAGSKLYFTVFDPDFGSELYTSDGTPSGTRRLADLWPGSNSSSPGELTPFGGALLFAATAPESGRELYVTDGTPGGTRLFIDINPGIGNGAPRNLTSLLGDVFLSADSGAGQEPHLLRQGSISLDSLGDLNPGLSSSDPSSFDRLGDLVLFSADSGRAGLEPWIVDLGADVGLPCVEDDETLCLLDGRISITSRFRNPLTWELGSGKVQRFPGSDRTGTFWFFNQSNVELLVKVLDGNALNGHLWVFYGALSDVEYWLDVVDTETGQSKTYYNAPGQFCGQADTSAFAAARFDQNPRNGSEEKASSSKQLALRDGRFEVEVDWKTHDNEGVGTAVAGTDETGYFWFFSPDNIELAIKILDGRPVNGRFWVYFAALSDVEYTVKVTDTASGEVRFYENPRGNFCGQAHIDAF